MDNSVYVYAGDELTRIFAIATSLSFAVGVVTNFAGAKFPSILYGERLGAFALLCGPLLALGAKALGVESVALDWLGTALVGLIASFVAMGGHSYMKELRDTKAVNAAKVKEPAKAKVPRSTKKAA